MAPVHQTFVLTNRQNCRVDVDDASVYHFEMKILRGILWHASPTLGRDTLDDNVRLHRAVINIDIFNYFWAAFKRNSLH